MKKVLERFELLLYVSDGICLILLEEKFLKDVNAKCYFISMATDALIHVGFGP